jgi:hypothetical protein
VVLPQADWDYQFYGLDASGNILATFNHKLVGQMDCMVSGKSYMVVGVSNNVDPTITTATVNILKPNAQTEVYTNQGPNFVQSFI